MTAKEYLEQIRVCDIKARNMKEEADRLRYEAMSLSSTTYGDKVSSSHYGGGISDMIVRSAEMELESVKMQRKYVELRHRIIKEIHALANPKYVQILYMRYVNYMTISQIAKKMGYEYKWTCRMHGDALDAFDRKQIEGFN